MPAPREWIRGVSMSLQDSMTARQRFYELLASASVPELEAIRIHVGLAALLMASYRFDLSRQYAQGIASGRGGKSPVERMLAKGGMHRDWLPDHLHYNYLRQRAPADLARQLDAASATVKEAPDSLLFSGYSKLGLPAERLLELMELMGGMYPKMMDGLRSFDPAVQTDPTNETPEPGTQQRIASA